MPTSTNTPKSAITAPLKADMTVHRADIIMPVLAFLQIRGLEPKIDSDGDIAFTLENGCRLYYQVAQNDHTCQSVLLMRIFPVDSAEDYDQALRVTARVNARIQVAKVVPFTDAVSVRADLFGDDPTLLMNAFDDIVGALISGARAFHRGMDAVA